LLFGLACALVAGAYGSMPPAPGAAAGAVRTAAVSAADEQAPVSSSIVIEEGASKKGYSTTSVTITQDGTLSVVNLDSMEHTVTADDRGSDGLPLFDVLVPPGATVSIPAASTLAAGTYGFHCTFHPARMTGTLTVEGSSGGVTPVAPKFEQPLSVPPVLTGRHSRVKMERSTVRMLPHGARTPMWTYGGTYPGPTIRRPAGSDTKVTFVNELPKRAGSMTVHFHGDHHASADDGQPDSYLIKHGASRTYDFPLTYGGKPEPSSFFWYHDHRMDRTSRNNWRGLQGMFIVDDRKSEALRLPSGRRDVPLLVSDRSFTPNNHLTNPHRHAATMTPDMTFVGTNAPPTDVVIGNRILVNGRFAPYLRVAATRYRLRLLNASSASAYNFALSDGRPFVQIGTGNGLLPRPVVRQSILLGPAQRADVVVDFHREVGENVVLRTVARSVGSTTGTGTRVDSLMEFRVRRTASDPSRIPSSLVPTPKIDIPSRVAKTWVFNLSGDSKTGTFWSINGKAFMPDRVDHRVRLGSTERWRIRNDSEVTHFVHIHAEQWHTVLRDGGRPPPWERGLEDTWRLDPGESVEVAAHFTDYAGPFMIHCHMLDHEDHGMMARFLVTPRARS
jgi:FtsP/CotA-like multicopper oxidase with cupredoxin domain